MSFHESPEKADQEFRNANFDFPAGKHQTPQFYGSVHVSVQSPAE